MLWCVVSSLYYANTVFTGQFATELSEDPFHKIFKYLVTLGFSLFLLLRYRMWLLLLPIGLLALQGQFLYSHEPLSRPIVDVVIIMIALFGLTPLLRILGPEGRARLPLVLVGTGIVVGLISIIEIYVLADLFTDYWNNTGGMRSISTLFNPNNLGLYLGACVIFLLGCELKLGVKLICFLPMAFGLVYSGSRTAWVALGVVLILSALFSIVQTGKQATALLPILPLFGLGAVWVVGTTLRTAWQSAADNLELRGFDSQTADIRLENFLTYLGRFDWSTLLPDLQAKNIALTTDSAYLILLNSFGLILLLLYTVLCSLLYRLEWRQCTELRHAWQWCAAYYLIAALADSTINAFPNNQLFFIAVGSVLCYRYSDSTLNSLAGKTLDHARTGSVHVR
jgi:hypothetical protein